VFAAPATVTHYNPCMSSALLSFDEAAGVVAACAAQLASRSKVERVRLDHAAGRTLAQSIRADDDQPAFARSTRDGYACRATEASTHSSLFIAGATRAGESQSGPLPPGAAWEIMTGAPVPEGADAVMMIEHVEVAQGKVRLLPPRTLTTRENVVGRGAQARAGDELVRIGTVVSYAQIALAASCGYASLDVFERPQVAILSTGDELVPVEAEPELGQIRNSSSHMLAAQVTAAGGNPWVLPIVRDRADFLDAALAEAFQADLVLVSGGVSAGKFDLVEPALARLGARFHFTGVRIQPGKPLVFGELPDRGSLATNPTQNVAKYFFGLPGNPISSAVTFELFASPLLKALGGRLDRGPRLALAQLIHEVKGRPGLTRFLPAQCNFTGELPAVERLDWQGSGDLAAMARSNCFLIVPEETGHLMAGAIVRILL
jgi:molybdopterin molybdotransferase